jgi:two-component system response regulator PilR (NtrC family)
VLAQKLLEKQCLQTGVPVPTIDEDVRDMLMRYSFPGNVRELENILERALALCDGKRIQSEDILLKSGIKARAPADTQGMALPDYLENIEKQAILEALQKTNHNKTAAAKLLGVSFRTLRYRLSKLGLSKEEID